MEVTLSSIIGSEGRGEIDVEKEEREKNRTSEEGRKDERKEFDVKGKVAAVGDNDIKLINSSTKVIEIDITVTNKILLAMENLKNPSKKISLDKNIFDLNTILNSLSSSASSLPTAMISIYTGVDDKVNIIH